MSHDLDTAGPVRPGEELPVATLDAFLAKSLPEVAGLLSVEQFPCGYSNLTYLLRKGDREFVLRRPPFGNQVKTAHDMGREFRVLSKLSAVYPPAPRSYFYCEDLEVLGAPFYVMERRRGVVLRHANIPGTSLDPPAARRLSEALIDNLALLHALDYKAAGLADLGRPDGYVQRQVTGWIGRYTNAQTEPLPGMDRIAQWLTDHQPARSDAALIHNDYKYDNLVLDPADLMRVVAVLDWEMATVGDPLMDLGTTLGYWVEAGDTEPVRAGAFGPTALPGSLTRQELVARYADMTGRDMSVMLFYYCFGVYKIAVIVQQIYARYLRGHTRDARFARLNERVATLCETALRAADTGQI
ncbi:MAG TPA: phosphotransferase family protein [Gemmataceae bacterium]|nr:phosphotransferase family protein [Gemmataceae bacterium]